MPSPLTSVKKGETLKSCLFSYLFVNLTAVP